mmetsp:Transcript_6548/g.10174  ORF Transcript_6548/g.10174 Transcript_6548/m.10174 type:complete len:178 (-) Transcript_6548:655-1188(-)
MPSSMRLVVESFLPESLSAGGVGPPFPDLVIASGRSTILSSVAIRKASGGRTKTVQIQHPRVSSSLFDAIVTPKHDFASSFFSPKPNVVLTDGSLTNITSARLQQADQRWQSRFSSFPKPIVAVLVGGSSNRFQFSRSIAEDLVDKLRRSASEEERPSSIFMTFSRRTPSEVCFSSS